MDSRHMNEYEPLPRQGGHSAAAAGSHDISRRSSLSASSGEFEYPAGADFLPDIHFRRPEISPPSSLRSHSQDSLRDNQHERDDYSPISRSSSDCNQRADDINGRSRSLDASERTQSVETFVVKDDNKGPHEVIAVRSDTRSSEKYEGVSAETPRPWTPFYLRRVTLAGFVVIYAALLVVLIVLSVFDNKNQGLATSNSSRHYLWTYGPTAGAFLAIVAAFWGQVEHRTKQMMPWAILRKGPSPAADVLLLDYVEPARTFALWTSIKNAHWPVAFAVVGALLLQLLTVVSTGLFQLHSERVEHPGVTLLYGKDFASEPRKDFAVGAAPVLSAIALNNGNISYPAGTSEGLAFPSLSLKNGISGAENISISSNADVFHAELSCEVVHDVRWDDTCFRGSSFYSDCKSAAGIVSFNASSCQVEDLDMTAMISGTLQAGVYGAAAAANCTNSPSEHRLTIAFLRYGLGLNYTGEETDNPALYMEPAPILVCRPSYVIDSQSIVMDEQGSLVSAGPQNGSTARAPDQLPISQWDLVENVLDSVANAYSVASGPANTIGDIGGGGAIRSVQDEFIYCLLAFLNPKSVTDLLDIGLLERESKRFYSSVTTQIAKDYLMVPSDREVSGDVTADQQRLRIRGLSFYMMVAILASLIIVAAVLYFLAPRNATSRDPGSTGGLAAIMAESPSLYDSLSGYGASGLSSLRNRLSNYSALSSMQLADGKPEFGVIMAPHSSTDTTRNFDEEVEEEKIHWWKPFAMSRVTKTGSILYLLALIAALEATYQTSVKNDGLANVETESYARYAWSYIPALSMFIAQLLVGMIGDLSKIFAPFHELRKGPCPAKALFIDPLSQTTIQNFFNAIATKQFALLATSFSMLLTPLLTIVASGLYSPETSQYSQDVTVKINDAFNLTNDVVSMQSAYVIGLLLQSNLTYPAWTYGEMAFPQLSLDTNQETSQPVNTSSYPASPSSAGNASTTIQVTVTAPRASLNCTYLPPGQAFVYYDDLSDKPGGYLSSANPSLNTSACSSDLLAATTDNDDDDAGNFSLPFGWTQSPTTCPFYQGVYGASTTDNSTVHGFACTPSVEALDVRLTLALPSYTILDAVPLENTASPYDGIHGWAWSNFDLSSIVPGAGYNANGTNTTTTTTSANSSTSSLQQLGDFDPVFQAILHQLASDSDSDSTSTPFAALVSSPTAAASSFPLLANTLQHIFRVAFAQAISRDFRSAPAPAAPTAAAGQQVLNATLHTPQLRLAQSAVSSRILEGLLAAVAAALLLQMLLRDHRGGGGCVLPKNPCSVGAGASLLAGARMVRLGEAAVPAAGVAWWGEMVGGGWGGGVLGKRGLVWGGGQRMGMGMGM